MKRNPILISGCGSQWPLMQGLMGNVPVVWWRGLCVVQWSGLECRWRGEAGHNHGVSDPRCPLAAADCAVSPSPSSALFFSGFIRPPVSSHALLLYHMAVNPPSLMQ